MSIIPGGKWELRVDLDRQLKFPHQITVTSFRPNLQTSVASAPSPGDFPGSKEQNIKEQNISNGWLPADDSAANPNGTVGGQARAPKGRCFCADKGVNMVPPKLIEKVEIIPPSPSCENQEIVVTLKNGTEQKCLNPESKFTQKYIMTAFKKRL
uniref:Chemokine ligand 11 n=1 Tax=Ctenopharyngodon idella TaxID=7959 RepID=A0A345D728_CTEID|nr:chemokine ligand 11 [Ctenopharyngodon idella]